MPDNKEQESSDAGKLMRAKTVTKNVGTDTPRVPAQVAADNKCYSCTGILLAFDAAKPPTCIGYENRETKKHFTADKMNALDRERKSLNKPKAEMSYVVFGYSMYPRKHTRVGGIPISRFPYGLMVQVHEACDQPKQLPPTQPQQQSEHQSRYMNNYPRPLQKDPFDYEVVATSASTFTSFTWRACVKQGRDMITLYRSTAPNFPHKMYASCEKLGASCVKTVVVCSRALYKVIAYMSSS
jgi:hypothetical protein